MKGLSLGIGLRGYTLINVGTCTGLLTTCTHSLTSFSDVIYYLRSTWFLLLCSLDNSIQAFPLPSSLISVTTCYLEVSVCVCMLQGFCKTLYVAPLNLFCESLFRFYQNCLLIHRNFKRFLHWNCSLCECALVTTALTIDTFDPA